jgi:hypothetical protein
MSLRPAAGFRDGNRAATVAVLAAALVALGACGGAKAPGKADFIRRADIICARGAARQRQLHTPQLSGTPSEVLSALGRYVGQLLPVARGIATQLHALAEPTQDRAELRRYFAAVDGAVADLQRLGEAARRGDAAAVRRGAVALNGNQANALARRYGFRVCGGGGGAPAA